MKKPFDRDGIATKTFNNHFNNPKSEYYHMTVEQIINKWETKAATSRQYGSMLDEYIGYNLNNDQDGLEMFNLDYDRDGDERLNNICNSFDTFVNDYLKQHPTLMVASISAIVTILSFAFSPYFSFITFFRILNAIAGSVVVPDLDITLSEISLSLIKSNKSFI